MSGGWAAGSLGVVIFILAECAVHFDVVTAVGQKLGLVLSTEEVKQAERKLTQEKTAWREAQQRASSQMLVRVADFLEEVSGIPVLLSMLVLIFSSDSESLPSSKLELYRMATRAFPDTTSMQSAHVVFVRDTAILRDLGLEPLHLVGHLLGRVVGGGPGGHSRRPASGGPGRDEDRSP